MVRRKMVDDGAFNAKSEAPVVNRKATQSFSPMLFRSLPIGNESEGKMRELFHDADNLSTRL